MAKKLIEVINDAEARDRVFNDALEYLHQHGYPELKVSGTGSIPNGCATTASHYLHEAGLLDYSGIEINCKALSNRLSRLGWVRFENPHDVRPGDVVFTIDKNKNGKPDHVFIAMGRPQDSPCLTVEMVDNQKHGRPHPRNLSCDRPKLPMDYAMRLPVKEDESEPVSASVEGQRRVFELLGQIYQEFGDLPQSARVLLNRFAHHPVFDQFREHDE